MKYAIVTGSSRGLGFEIALSLAKKGDIPVITGRNEFSLSESAEKIKSVTGREALPVLIDFSEEDASKCFYDKLKKKNVSPSIIINNLGGAVVGDKRNIDIRVLRETLRLNLEVGIEINNIFFEDLKRLSGTIVHIGSTAALHYDAPPCYTISKSALNAYIKNAAPNFARDGVCIFGILPGILDHEGSIFNRIKISDPDRYQKAIDAAAYRRFVKSSEVAEYVVKLLGVESQMINGALIKIDGGTD